MPERIYPITYLVMAALILMLSLFLITNFLGEKPSFNHFPFLLLGAGFMLVETKGITELGLTFGNSWHVIGIAIAGIMVMAFLANCVVQWLNIERPHLPYLLLLATLAAGWWIARGGGITFNMGGACGNGNSADVTYVLLRNRIFNAAEISRRHLRNDGNESVRRDVWRIVRVQFHVFRISIPLFDGGGPIPPGICMGGGRI